MLHSSWRRGLLRLAAPLLAGAALVGGLAGAGAARAASPSVVPGSSWAPFLACAPPNTSQNCAVVRAITTSSDGSTIYIGGTFSELIQPGTSNTFPAQDLAAINERTGQPVQTFAAHIFAGSVGPATDPCIVCAVALSPPDQNGNQQLYAGGRFTSVDGLANTAHLAMFDPTTGALNASFSATARVGNTVQALLCTASTLYIGLANLTATVQGQSGQAFALNPTTGAINPNFSVNLTFPDASPVNPLPRVMSFAMPLDNSRLYIAGAFDTINGTAQKSLAAVDPSTGAVDPSFTAQIQAFPNDPLQQGDQVIPVQATQGTAAGVLLAQAGHYNRIYRFNDSGRTVWSLAPNGDVQAIAMAPGTDTVFMGGHFKCVTGCTRQTANRVHIAAVTYNNVSHSQPALLSWSPSLEPHTGSDGNGAFFGVWALDLVANGGDLWAGGVFNTVQQGGATYNQPKLAVFRSSPGNFAAPAPAAGTAPALNGPASGSLELFDQRYDRSLEYVTGSPGAWSNPINLGGVLTSAPAAVTINGWDRVFVVGTDGGLYEQQQIDSTGDWSGFSGVSGKASAAPAVATSAPGRIDLFVRGTDGALWYRSETISGTTGTWSSWQDLGGRLASGTAPAATSTANGELTVAVTGTDGRPYLRILPAGGSHWGGWLALNGRLLGSPALASQGTHKAEIAIRGTNNHLYLATSANDGASFGAWKDFGGVLSASPALTATGGQTTIAALGSNGRPYTLQPGTSWQLVS